MRLTGFKCDRCGRVITDQDYCKLSDSEVGREFLADFHELKGLELCDDCYEEFRSIMRDTLDDFLGECDTYPYTEDGDYRYEEREDE